MLTAWLALSAALAVDPELIHRVDPDFPVEEAEAMGIRAARCTTNVVMNHAGHPQTVEVSGCDPIFHELLDKPRLKGGPTSLKRV